MAMAEDKIAHPAHAPMIAGKYDMKIVVRPDGSGMFIIYHGGMSVEYPFNDDARKEIIKLFGGTPSP